MDACIQRPSDIGYDKGTFLSLLHFYGTRLAYGLQDAEVATEGPFRGGAEVTTLPDGQKRNALWPKL